MSTLIIKNVPSHVDIYSIKDLCRKYGKMVGCLRTSNGSIKVKMLHAKDAKRAYNEINGMHLLGNLLEVRLQ